MHCGIWDRCIGGIYDIGLFVHHLACRWPAPGGAIPSAGRVLTTKVDMFSPRFIWLSLIIKLRFCDLMTSCLLCMRCFYISLALTYQLLFYSTVHPKDCTRGSCLVVYVCVCDHVPQLISSDTVRCRYNALNFLTNIHKKRPIARPLGRGMGCFCDPASDWYSASVPVIFYVISYNVGPRYNGTQLYLFQISFDLVVCSLHQHNISIY